LARAPDLVRWHHGDWWQSREAADASLRGDGKKGVVSMPRGHMAGRGGAERPQTRPYGALGKGG